MRCLFVMALALLLPACVAPVPMATAEADVQGESFSPPTPGRGVLYVYREGMFAPALTVSISVGERRLSALAIDTWFRVDLDPGQYEIRCTTTNTDYRIVRLVADEISFIKVAMK